MQCHFQAINSNFKSPKVKLNSHNFNMVSYVFEHRLNYTNSLVCCKNSILKNQFQFRNHDKQSINSRMEFIKCLNDIVMIQEIKSEAKG